MGQPAMLRQIVHQVRVAIIFLQYAYRESQLFLIRFLSPSGPSMGKNSGLTVETICPSYYILCPHNTYETILNRYSAYDFRSPPLLPRPLYRERSSHQQVRDMTAVLQKGQSSVQHYAQ